MENTQERLAGFREESEIDVIESLTSLWAQRWYVIGSVILFVAAAAAYAYTATVWYRAEVVLAPAERKTSQLSMGALGSLASVAGLDIGSNPNSQAQLAVLKSRGFARDFIVDQKLTAELIEQSRSGFLRGLFSSKDDQDVRDAVKFFDTDVRSVDEDRKNGLVLLGVTWTDPDVAAKWANMLAQRVNDRLRERELAEVTRNLEYLKGELVRTQVAPLQQSLSRMIESEMQKLLVARGDNEFAFKVIDPATPPREKSKPRRMLILAGAGAVGTAVGLFVGSLVNSYKRKRRIAGAAA